MFFFGGLIAFDCSSLLSSEPELGGQDDEVTNGHDTEKELC